MKPRRAAKSACQQIKMRVEEHERDRGLYNDRTVTLK